MAASIKIEFDDGSRVISQTLEDAAGEIEKQGLLASPRPESCSMDDFYEIPRTTEFIAKGNFQRVALQFPDHLLREAPQVLWALQAQLRKQRATAGDKSSSESGEVGGRGAEEVREPLIFVTGDTSYGSCCVDEISAKHLKADAIVHYGRACLSPTSSSVPVLYVFGRGSIDVEHLAQWLLEGPLQAWASPCSGATTQEPAPSTTPLPPPTTLPGSPVLLLYDVTYAHAIPALLQTLERNGVTQDEKFVVGFPSPQAYSSSLMAGSAGTTKIQSKGQLSAGYGAGCGRDGSSPPAGVTDDVPTTLPKTASPSCCGSIGAEKGGDVVQETQMARYKTASDEASCASSGRVQCCGETSAKGINARDESGAAPAVTVETVTSLMSQSALESCPQTYSSPSARTKRAFRIGGLGMELESEEALKEHAVIFVGAEGRQLSNVLLRCSGCRHRMRYDPSQPPADRLVEDTRRGNKDLMRRYYLVQRAREASIIGIVVGTLGVQQYGKVVRSLRKMVEDEGRKAYTLAVGKINVAKLANFAEVDVFCLVACAENSLLDSKEFHAPVVTPLELEVALGRRQWDGFYSTDFEDLTALAKPTNPSEDDVSSPEGLNASKHSPNGIASGGGDGSDGLVVLTSRAVGNDKISHGQQLPSMAADLDNDGDEPFFSLVSGTFKSVPGVSRRRAPRHPGSGSDADTGAAGGDALRNDEAGALVEIGERSLTEWSSPAADFLNKREFKGLEPLIGQTEAKAATEGQSGIASDYRGF